MLDKTQWSDPFNFCSGIYSCLKNTFQLVGFQFGGPYWHFFYHKMATCCQRNYEGCGFSVEDEMSVKIGPVNNACRECAGPEVISSSRVCASRNFLQSQKGRENDDRYTRAIKFFNNEGTTAVIVCLTQIHSWK